MAEDKKKLIFVITQPVVGGAQKYVFDLAKYFNQGGNYEVGVAIGGATDGYLFEALKKENIKTISVKNLARNISIIGDLKTFFELIKIFKKEQPDIIHLNSSKVGVLGALAAFFYKLTTNNYKLKTIFTAHGWIFKEEMSSKMRFVAVFLAWLAAKFQDKIICVSQDDFNKALQNKIAPPKKLFTIYNAVSEGKILNKEKARVEINKMIGMELPHDAFVITNLGRLYANKGLNYLIEAVTMVKKKLPEKEILLVIFGDGPEREALQLLITKYQLLNTVFLVGDKPDVSQYLKAFDAMVLSSVKEGFPYAVLEAGVANIPVVATDVGGIGEIIKDGETGILIEPKNIKALAESILKVLSDNKFSQKISANLKKVITKDFNFENLIEKTEWVYKV